MKRIKRHKIKTEKKEASYSRENEEHDLAYYIHDRVELMHQVFSVLKYKDLKAMAPESVRNLPIGDLQELCTEELLGISSKRLLATLDGCDPPSDTESSSASPSPEQLETISLDSISSDEEILSQSSKKKKHKHHRRNLKSKNKKKEKEKEKDKSKENKAIDDSTEVNQASRAGLTVLELLELQARARAIRAQLQNEQAKKQQETAAAASDDDDDDVEIKEEAPDVVEISSGDEKPDINALQAAVQQSPKEKEVTKSKEKQKGKSKENKKSKETNKAIEKTKQIHKPTEPAKDTQNQNEAENKNDREKTVTTKRINDLIITVPQAKPTKKIKLNRNKITVTVANVPEIIPVDNRTVNKKLTQETPKEVISEKKKKKKTKKKKNLEKEGSDHDEITLQLSDTEKMDLLEDLEGKNYRRVSSGSSDSSESSSSSDCELDTSKESVENYKDLNKTNDEKDSNEIESSEVTKVPENIPINDDKILSDHEANFKVAENEKDSDESVKTTLKDSDKDRIRSPGAEEIEKESISQGDVKNPTEMSKNTDTIEDKTEVTHDNLQAMPKVDVDEVMTEVVVDKKETELNLDITKSTPESYAKEIENKKVEESPTQLENIIQIEKDTEPNKTGEQNLENEEAVKMIEINKIGDIPLVSNDINTTQQESKDGIENKNEREISEGELSDRGSSEVEAYDVPPEVVCISDDEKQNKKKKKKDKKAKKEKKSKKSKKDFREGGDQNFYKDAKTQDRGSSHKDDLDKMDDDITAIDLTEDDVYEILSDDSSCYEVEGTYLSKEPTAEEIATLSARIDEIKREDLEQTNINTTIENSPQTKSDASDTEVEQISWKDRYLDSTKVKRVLTTANILNALRKKNKDLKKKIADAKKIEMESQEGKVVEVSTEHYQEAPQDNKVLEEGSIEHYQTLQGSSKYINPEPDSSEAITEDVSKEDTEGQKDQEGVTKEMKKDAKLLLKMYRKLLNNKKIKRQDKKKKRKMKKKEEAVTETAD